MSQLTRRVFVDTAEILKATKGEMGTSEEVAAVNTVARKMAAYFRSENPRFDSDRFLKACGIKEA